MPDPAPVPVAAPLAEGDAGGTLILVVGPSGAGKDTLIDAARAHFSGDGTIRFGQRCITREDQIGEQHAALSQAQFARREGEGGFFLSWQAHGLGYGIGSDVLEALEAGNHVVLNVSRRIVGEARQKWPRTHVIQITARPEILRERLLARGRESAGDITGRLERAGEIRLAAAEWLSEVDNSGDLASAAARFVALISSAAKGCSPISQR